jgi:hypothetical protein
VVSAIPGYATIQVHKDHFLWQQHGISANMTVVDEKRVYHKKGKAEEHEYNDLAAGGFIAGILAVVTGLAVILKLSGAGASDARLKEINTPPI